MSRLRVPAPPSFLQQLNRVSFLDKDSLEVPNRKSGPPELHPRADDCVLSVVSIRRDRARGSERGNPPGQLVSARGRSGGGRGPRFRGQRERRLYRAPPKSLNLMQQMFRECEVRACY